MMSTDGASFASAAKGTWRMSVSNREVVAGAVSYTHLRAHETVLDLVCRLLLEKKKKKKRKNKKKKNNNSK